MPNGLVAGPATHYAELGSDELVLDPEDALRIYGRFPVAEASDLVAVFESAAGRVEIVCEGKGGAELRIPKAGMLPPGAWSLTLDGRADGSRTSTPLRIVVPRHPDSFCPRRSISLHSRGIP